MFYFHFIQSQKEEIMNLYLVILALKKIVSVTDVISKINLLYICGSSSTINLSVIHQNLHLIYVMYLVLMKSFIIKKLNS